MGVGPRRWRDKGKQTSRQMIFNHKYVLHNLANVIIVR